MLAGAQAADSLHRPPRPSKTTGVGSLSYQQTWLPVLVLLLTSFCTDLPQGLEFLNFSQVPEIFLTFSLVLPSPVNQLQ